VGRWLWQVDAAGSHVSDEAGASSGITGCKDRRRWSERLLRIQYFLGHDSQSPPVVVLQAPSHQEVADLGQVKSVVFVTILTKRERTCRVPSR